MPSTHPLADKAVGRVFMSHLYGLLWPAERSSAVMEAHRVSGEIVILDSGAPAGVRPEEWQTRTLPDGTSYPIYRQHFDVETLPIEVRGQALYEGQYFVLVRT